MDIKLQFSNTAICIAMTSKLRLTESKSRNACNTNNIHAQVMLLKRLYRRGCTLGTRNTVSAAWVSEADLQKGQGSPFPSHSYVVAIENALHLYCGTWDTFVSNVAAVRI